MNLIFGLAPNESQTGDGGLDGRGKFLNEVEGFEYRGVLAQVKSGTFTTDSVRAFARTIEAPDNRSVAGVFLTMEPNATTGMKAEAAKLGAFRLVGSSREYPRFSFWSIEEHFAGRTPDLPPLADPLTGKERRTFLETPTLLERAGETEDAGEVREPTAEYDTGRPARLDFAP